MLDHGKQGTDGGEEGNERNELPNSLTANEQRKLPSPMGLHFTALTNRSCNGFHDFPEEGSTKDGSGTERDIKSPAPRHSCLFFRD